MARRRIRRQVDDLVPEDFAFASIWEFALDEESLPGQDEATVKPRPELESADPDEGLFVVEAEFVCADGTRFTGYVTPQREDDIGLIQPTIVTGTGQVNFWLGAFPPKTLTAEYATLGKQPSELFPLRYRAVVPAEGVDLEGELHGFMSQALGSDEVVTAPGTSSQGVGAVMNDFVDLELRKNRGWPWPENSWSYVDRMFGEDGWCRECGIPNRPQCGSLVLQARGFSSVEGAWVPNWEFDAYCLECSLAERVVAAGFELPLLPIEWHGRSSPADAVQIVAPTIGETWFDPDELRERTIAEHGAPGARCDECGVWRSYPLGSDELPPYRYPTLGADVHVAASPEWFGDGLQSFRQIIFRRELAEMIVAASPRDFQIKEIQVDRSS